MGKIFDDYVKKCQGFWSSNYSTFSQLTNPSHLNQKAPYPGFEVAVFNDRGKGGTHGSNVYEKENGLLIVGCNPSGIAKHHNYRKPVPCYENPDCKNFYIINTYPLANDPYTYAIEDFAKKCGYGQNYYKMDFIGIMRKEQRVLEDDMNNGLHNTLYAKLFEIFVDTVIALKPEKIVIVNAFISNLICDRKKSIRILLMDMFLLVPIEIKKEDFLCHLALMERSLIQQFGSRQCFLDRELWIMETRDY